MQQQYGLAAIRDVFSVLAGEDRAGNGRQDIDAIATLQKAANDLVFGDADGYFLRSAIRPLRIYFSVKSKTQGVVIGTGKETNGMFAEMGQRHRLCGCVPIP